MFLVSLMLLFFMRVFKEKDSELLRPDPLKDKLLFSFLVIMSWLSVVLLIPIIRSYTVAPMTMSRYFIGLIPAIIIIVAIGLYYINNRLARTMVLGIIIAFSLTDIFYVKQHHTKPVKLQFRELSEFVQENNKKNEPVITDLYWYVDFFFARTPAKASLVDKSLEMHIDEMIVDSTRMAPFWFMYMNNRHPPLPEKKQKFLDDHFVVTKSKEGVQSLTSHYALRRSEEFKEIDITEFKPLDTQNGDVFRFYIDGYDTTAQKISARGFAFFENQASDNSSIQLVMVGNEKAFLTLSQMERRDDVTTYYKSKVDIGNSGFRMTAYGDNLPPGKYQLGILISNPSTNKKGLALTGYFYTKQ
jgi:hypothetical protein